MAPNPFQLLSDHAGDTSSAESRSGTNTPQSNGGSSAAGNHSQKPTKQFYNRTHQFSERKRHVKNTQGNKSTDQAGPSKNLVPDKAPFNGLTAPIQAMRAVPSGPGQQANPVPPVAPSRFQTERRQRAHRSAVGVPSESKKWAKNVSLTETLRRRDDLKHEKEVLMWERRQRPPPSQTFIAAGTFHWPETEFDAEEALGKDLMRLDGIRKTTRYSCHIVYEKEKGAIQVMSTRNEQDLKDALGQLRVTVFQLFARQTSLVKEHLLHWHDSNAPCPNRVAHIVYPGVSIVMPMSADKQVSLVTPSGEGSQAGTLTKVLSQRHSSRAKGAILRKLEKLVHYEGHLHFRIRSGTFIATRYKPPVQGQSYAFDEYRQMLALSQFEGHVSQEASRVGIEQHMLGKLRNATSLFVPYDNDVSDLTDIRPIYTATFTFSNLPGITVDVRLVMTWTPDHHSQTYRLTTKRWFTFDTQTPSHPRPLLELNLIDVTQNSAWTFSLTALHSVVNEAQLPGPLLSFAGNVTLHPTAFADHPTAAPIAHPPSPLLKRKETRSAYQVRFDRGEFVLELSRFQTVEASPAGHGVAGPLVSEYRWAVNLFCPEWDALFSQNDGLAVGKPVEWSGDASQWFPPDTQADWSTSGDGWVQLLEKMRRTEALLLCA